MRQLPLKATDGQMPVRRNRDSASGDRTRKLKRRTQLRKVIPAIIVILGIHLAIGRTGCSNDAEKQFEEGNLKLGGGDFEGAIKALDKAIELKPDYAEAYRTQGTAKAVLKQHFSYLQAETTVGLEKVQ